VIQDRLGIAHDHVLRPGRTIADLACSGEIETAHLAEALQ
jgi:predicted ATPase with chaperone activity